MKYFSTFSGIGGFELGIQQAYESYKTFQQEPIREGSVGECGESSRFVSNNRSGRGKPAQKEGHRMEQWICVGYSEIDKYASSIYQKHFPEHKQYGDITKINADTLPDFDLLVGGFPCQAFSIAGKRKGFDDTRGTLFFDLARILKAKQPRLFVFENVKGLLSHSDGNTFKTIISTLDELGYDLQWQVLNSKNHGVPQNRERVFIVGHLRGTSRPQIFPIGTSDEQDVREGTYAHTLNSSDWRGPNRNQKQTTIRTDEQDSQEGGNQPDNSNNIRRTPYTDGARIRRLTPTECERLQGFPEIEICAILEVCKQANANGAEITLNTKVTDQENVAQASVLIDCVEHGVEIHSQGKLLLNAKNAEKKNWSHPHIKIDDFVQLLVGISTIEERIIRRGEEGLPQNEQSLTAQQNGKKQERLSGNEITQPVGDAENDLTTVKELLKLTTLSHSDIENLEQKLQTLSLFVIRAISGYIPNEILNQNTFTIGVRTRVGYTYGVSDTQRYKVLGNAVTVNVIRDIFERILKSPR